MKCPNCGAELNEGVAFCTSCGTPMTAQETPAAPAAPEKTENELNKVLDQLMDKLTPVAVKIKDFLSVKKNLAIVGGALVAVILFFIIVSAVSSANTGFITYDDYYSLSANDDDNVVILKDGKVIETSIEYVSPSGSRSQDGSVYAFLSGGNLAYVKGGKVVEVEEEVSSFKIASGGKYIVYVADEGSALYLYSVGGESTKIEDDVNITSYTISPNGKSVLYSVYDDEDGDTPVYFYNGKESVKVASSGNALGVADGGKYIYYSATNDKGETNAYSYNKNKEEKTKLASLSGIRFNSDLSQALIINAEGKTYVSVKGAEAEKVSGKSLYLIIAGDSVYSNSIAPVDDFFGKLYSSSDNDIYKVEKNPDKTEKILSNYSDYYIDESYETLHYTDDDGDFFVTKISYGEKAKEKAKQIAEEVYDFVITSNGKIAYYRADEDVYAINAKGGKAKRVSSDDVTSYLTLDDKDVLYFFCDDELHAVKGKKASVCVLEDCNTRYLRGGYLYAIDDDSFYYIKGTKSEKLFDYSELIISLY